jgi:hypothetical protein
MPRTIAVAVIIALLQATGVHAQAPVRPPDGWDTAVTAPLGTRVRLTLQNGTVVRGLLAEVQTDALVMTDNTLERGELVSRSGSMKDPHTFARAEIKKAQAEGMAKPMSARKQVLMIFAAAGALIGGLLLALLVWCAPDDSPCHGA